MADGSDQHGFHSGRQPLVRHRGHCGIAVAGGDNLWGFPGGTIAFSYMAYSWAKGIDADGESVPGNPARPGKYGYNTGLGRCYRCVIRESYAHGSTDINPGGQAYGIVVGVGTSASLIENNISVYNNKPVTLNSTGGGNVIAYNYVGEAILWNSPGWQENAIDNSHANFTHPQSHRGQLDPQSWWRHDTRQLWIPYAPSQLCTRDQPPRRRAK